MALKKNYFYQAKLINSSTGKQCTDMKEMICKIIEDYGRENTGEYIDAGSGKEKKITYYSVEALPTKDDLHVSVDIFDYKDDHLFFRACCQKPSNSFTKREYSTLKNEEISIDNEVEGIEQYTFCYYDYETKIFSLIRSLGAPGKKILNDLIEKYYTGYTVELLDIPNRNGVKKLYRAQGATISQIELELPQLKAELLEEIFGWKGNKLLQIEKDKHYKVDYVIKPATRGDVISSDNGWIKEIIDIIKTALPNYTKAKVKGKENNGKMKTYNFMEENFANEVDVPTYQIAEGKRRYYENNQLIEIFRNHLVVSFNENIEFLKGFNGDDEDCE